MLCTHLAVHLEGLLHFSVNVNHDLFEFDVLWLLKCGEVYKVKTSINLSGS